jgi:beta-N-acetylhexosaminidase
MTANVRQAAGNLLVVGLSGAELTGLERAWLKLVRPAGIILFRRNIKDPSQTRALLTEAAVFGSAHSMLCVDVEGGTVDRLRDALAPMPSVQAVAHAAVRIGNPGLTHEHGELVARAVKAFGFNTALAPVLDLALPDSAQIMGTRTAAATGAGVVEYARGFLAGLSASGVVGCGKHFPGLGGGQSDSHLVTPIIRRSYRDLWSEDLLPYRELSDELPMIMMDHAAYPDTPSRNRPASASPFWIATVLRERIGYRGMIFSDDLEMGGILKFMPIGEAAIAALRAGTDLLEICHTAEQILLVFEALIAEGERSAAFRKLLFSRARQTDKMRAKLFNKRIPRALSARQFEALRNRIVRFGKTIAKASSGSENPAA